MAIRMSTLFLRTLREDPADAEVPSHRLLLRGGYIRRSSPGVYSWLPLGRLLLDQVNRVIREEMAATGAQEVSLPSLLPRDVFDESGRWTEYGEEMFRLRDRRGGDYLLGPTHEEMFTLLVKDLYSSYRDYPVTLFQIGTKFRDEKRPRAGLLRGREFLMKDAYSFDLTREGLDASYAAQRAAYIRVFARLGLTYEIVTAVSGPMGGSASEEFLARAAVGEDTYAGCSACGYAANVEAVVTPAPAAQPVTAPAMTVVDTPDTPTIESLVKVIGELGRDITAAQTLKNVVFFVREPDGTGAPLIVGVPGDRDVDQKRLEAVLYPATVSIFEDFAAYPQLVPGYIGPQGLEGVRYLADPRVTDGTAWVTGANAEGKHALDVVCGRDFTPDGTIEAATVREGDPCPGCGNGLSMERGIEIAHIFQLGTRYTDVYGLDALDASGELTRILMGSYGIGVSRAIASIAEQHHDEHGLMWPAEIAPAQVHVVALGNVDAALDLAASLESAGLRVMVDDRAGISAGVRFADADLLGAPHIVVVGRRYPDGYVELKTRATGNREDVQLDALTSRLAR
ncbi:proline--tRNA ligase [Longispora albida]|uniref:proline--tRNA ligase n=1 Tax=Longispora albida TaxID=203523 RepID=UPI000476F468|nr:proline--tRNA ligase [Longispora albida]